MNVFLFLSVGCLSVFSFVAIASWSDARRREREAYYRSETLRRITEAPGAGANAALEIIREENRDARRRLREAHKLGGLVAIATSIGLMIFLRAIATSQPVYLVGLIPLFCGAALLAYAYVLTPGE